MPEQKQEYSGQFHSCSQRKVTKFNGNIICSTLPANKIWNEISKSLIVSEGIPD